jgi:hypothetical protein
MLLNTTFNNISVISWQSVLLVEEYDLMIVGSTTMHITTKVVSSNQAHDEVYSIQHYVIKVCQ